MQIHDTLWHYARVVRRRLWFVFSGVLLASATTCATCFFIAPTYQATSLVQVRSTSTLTTNDVFSAQALAVSYALLVTDPAVLHSAASRVSQVPFSEFTTAISASPVDNTQLIQIRAQASGAEKAARMANAVATAFVQVQMTAEDRHQQVALGILSQHLLQARLTVDTAQQQLTTLQNNHADETTIVQQRSTLDTDQANYNALLNSYELVQTQRTQIAGMLRIVQVATIPDHPVGPQILLDTFLTAVLGLLLTLLLVILWDWLDATVKTTADVTNLTSLTPLGSVPAASSAKFADTLLDLSVENNDLVRERLSLLGTNLLALHTGARAILVTGLRSRSGVSTTATYLALSLAQAGKRVLLIDANLHHPVLHRVFQRSEADGLMSRLMDVHRFHEQPAHYPQLWLDQWTTYIPDLWFLPAGPPSSHSATVMRTPEIKLLQDWFLGRHPDLLLQSLPALVDFIIFDSCALYDRTDTQALAATVDATLLVIEAAKEYKESLAQAQATLQLLNAPILGVTLNRQLSHHLTYLYTSRPAYTDQQSPKFMPQYSVSPSSLIGATVNATATNPSKVSSMKHKGSLLQRQYLTTETPVPSRSIRAKTTDQLPVPVSADEQVSLPRRQFSPLLRARGASSDGGDYGQKL